MQEMTLPDVDRVSDLVAYWAQRQPQAPALLDQVSSLNYAELNQALSLATDLLIDLGIRQGDRLAIVGENSISVPLLMLAGQAAGAWPAILNPRLTAPEINAMIDRIEPRRVVFATGTSEASRGHAALHDASLLHGWVLPEVIEVSTLLEATTEPPAEAIADDIGVLIFTSGTTGIPKAVMHSHGSLLNIASVLTRSRGTGPGHQVIGSTPLPHIMGLSNFVNALFAGASIKLSPRMDIAELAESISKGELTTISMVPTAFQRLLDYIEEQGLSMDHHRLQYVSAAGATLDPNLKAQIESVLKTDLVNGYGMTECAPVSRSRPGDGGPTGCIGRPDDGVAHRLVDESGVDVAEGDIGEMWFSGRVVMKGYFRDPEATAACFPEPGWFNSGDLARQLPDGQLEVVGRRKEMIIRSGFNVYPAEVEAAINALPGVRHSAVVGRPAEQGNEEVVAFIEALPGEQLDEAVIRAALKDRIAPYKRPGEIRIMSALPLGATGKIKKVDLSRLARES